MARVVITGSSKGIGFGLAREFLKRGHQVLISGSSETSVSAAAAALSDYQQRLQAQAADVTEAVQVQALWNTASAEFGGVDIWINNAGLARTVWPILETPDDQIQAMIHTNMLGTINGCRVAARGMLQQGSGKIFNMLGGGSDGEIFPGMGIYGTTKRGLDYFTNTLMRELKDSPLIIAKIRPGMVITEGVIREIEADRQNFEKKRKLMNRLCDTVETVSPFLVEQILNTRKSGRKIRWLTGGRIAGRLLLGPLRNDIDKFSAYGL